MQATSGIDLVVVTRNPFAQWTVLNQIALQGRRGIAFAGRCVLDTLRKPLFYVDIVKSSVVW